MVTMAKVSQLTPLFGGLLESAHGTVKVTPASQPVRAPPPHTHTPKVTMAKVSKVMHARAPQNGFGQGLGLSVRVYLVRFIRVRVISVLGLGLLGLSTIVLVFSVRVRV